MPQLSLRIKDTEVISLVEQLPKKKKQALLKRLIMADIKGFEEISSIGEKRFLAFCKKKGIDPNRLSEKEKEKLIDRVLHENN